jgi:RNA polymerase sigma-70 factor (ECF subfamily)
MTRRPQLAEEVLNDTLFVVWNRPESFSGRSKLSTWIFGIAYRKALKAMRRQDQPIEDEQLETRPGAEIPADERMERSEASLMLSKAINELSPDHRAVVDLCYFGELGYREIAEIVDCPVDTVKTRMFHARRHLKGRLAGELTDWL